MTDQEWPYQCECKKPQWLRFDIPRRSGDVLYFEPVERCQICGDERTPPNLLEGLEHVDRPADYKDGYRQALSDIRHRESN